MSIDTSKKINAIDYNGTPMIFSQPTAKGLADGSLTSFSAPALGVTSLKNERFRAFTSLQTLDLTGVTNIPDYTAYDCTRLTSLTIDTNTTNIGQFAFSYCGNANLGLEINLNMNGVVGGQAFSNAKIKSIKGTYTSIGSYAFMNDVGLYPLTEIDCTINGPIEQYAFNGQRNVSIFNLSPNSNITSLDQYAFQYFGYTRSNPSTNVFTFDLRNSTFTAVNPYCFSRGIYFDIYLPSTVTSIATYAFRYGDNLNIYYNSVPSLANTNAFGNTNNCVTIKNFFPYNLVQTAKTSTNWSSSTNGIVGSLVGYSQANEFNLGDTLPDTDADGYALTWYSNPALTTQVTTVSDPTQMYYCAVGSQIKTKLSITEYQATCTVSDGVNTYANGSLVPIGSTLTITAAGTGDNNQKYLFTLNGTDISSGDTYTVTSTSIEIKCIYWDGINQPILSNFADNTWDQIAVAISLGLHRTMWPITPGSTVSKPITLTNGTVVNVRLADSTADRYEFSDGSGYSQGVLEFDVCIPTAYYMNSTNTNAGGWPASYMHNTVMPIVYNMLPNDLKSKVIQVKKGSTAGNSSSSMVYADDYCFLPSASEIFSSLGIYAYNEGPIYQYYNGVASSVRIKQRSGSNSIWWLASPYISNSTNFCNVFTDGSLHANGASLDYGAVSVCFCIG